MRPTYAEVDLGAIAHNVREVVARVRPASVMAVVKADAYGHGVEEVARTAIRAGATCLGVALIEEGIRLRDSGFEQPTLVFGGFFDDDTDAIVRHRLEATIYDLERAVRLAKAATRQRTQVAVHVKVDTGMGRVGVSWHKVAELVTRIASLDGLKIAALMTHLATSDERDKSFAHLQLQRFQQVAEELSRRGIRIPLRHAANSGAILDLPEATYDLVRPGVMLYGCYPSEETSESIRLWPAMRLVSHVIYVKTVPAGTPISYGRRHTAASETRIATVPIGYADGYNRLLSNQGEVLIRGERFPVVGRVCMDQIMVDVGPGSAVSVGDEVVLLGRQGAAEIPIWEICRKLGTIPYEVTCRISERVPRVYVNEGEQENEEKPGNGETEEAVN